jgi:hypothetical protein
MGDAELVEVRRAVNALSRLWNFIMDDMII